MQESQSFIKFPFICTYLFKNLLSAENRISFKIFVSPQFSCTTRCPVLAVHQVLQPQGKLQNIT